MDWDVRVDQARIVQTLKLKKAAILQLREKMTPADALKKADLPADASGTSTWSDKLRKMRGHLKQHIDDWAADDWGGRASPSPPTTASATSSPHSSAASTAATAAPTPKVFLTIPQNEEMKELERKVAELEAEKKKRACWGPLIMRPARRGRNLPTLLVRCPLFLTASLVRFLGACLSTVRAAVSRSCMCASCLSGCVTVCFED